MKILFGVFLVLTAACATVAIASIIGLIWLNKDKLCLKCFFTAIILGFIFGGITSVFDKLTDEETEP